jgi:hypothetical protein
VPAHAVEEAGDRRAVLGVDPAQIGRHPLGRPLRELRVEAVEVDFPRVARIGVPAAQPAEEVGDLLRAPHPVAETGEELSGLAAASLDVGVEVERLRPVGLDGDDGEAHLRDEMLDHPVLELEDLAAAVGGLAQADDPRLADDPAERREVVEPEVRRGAGERDGVRSHPVDHLLRRRGGRG